jgi:OOP family OmpA-OmpF porin
LLSDHAKKESAMNRKLLIGAVGCAALLGACSSTQTAQTQPSTGTEFTRELARQYHGFGEQQRLEAYDWGSAGFFHRKGDVAAAGNQVPPETPGQRFTPRRDPAVASELTAARQRLDAALASPATTRATRPLARAQVRYDCWLESTDDPTLAVRGEWLTRKLQECRNEFEASMNEVDVAMRPAPVPVAAAAPREQSYLVFFDFDKYALTPEGQQVIQRAVDTFRAGGRPRIVATGHADRAGPEDYNMSLSDRRAAAVRQALVSAGIPANEIGTVAKGETQPLVPTPDGEREPQNRRVEIQMQ